MVSRLFRDDDRTAPPHLNKLDATIGDVHTPSKKKVHQLSISEFFTTELESSPSSTKQRCYSKRGTKDTCMGKRPPLGLVKFADFTKEQSVLKWWFVCHASRQEAYIGNPM
jgi:hypothetical protein